MTPAHNQLNRLNFAGVIALNGAGKAQLNTIHRGGTHLLKQKQFCATDREFSIQCAIIQPHIDIHRARHTAAAILLKLTGEFRQG
ncbi:hypothetical protein SDC9_199772 [bioreactor metagenome]|uniref:Uncharacterized protein n=1 Tax=bioreactor metagenome TaxID=1076179 RepID=A0A645ILE3_9ZZZZ